MVRAFWFAVERVGPTATTWWFGPIGGLLAAGLLWLAGVPVTFSEFIPNTIARAAFEVAICVVVAYLIIFIFWIAAYPIHLRFAEQGGFRSALRQRLGAQMGPLVLIGIGFLSFALFSGGGFAWLLLQAAQGPTTASVRHTEVEIKPPPSTQPDLALLPTKARYTFRWDVTKAMYFDFQKGGERLVAGQIGNPGLILRNASNVAAGDVTIIWDVEIDDFKELSKIGRVAGVINFPDDYTMDLAAKNGTGLPNFRYNPNSHAESKITFVARDADLWLPLNITPIVGLFLAAKMPTELGAKTEPLPIHLNISWNVPTTASLNFRIKVRGINAVPSGSPDSAAIVGYLDFEIERLN